MIVSCPICSTKYSVDPRALGFDGRMVRCAQCSHTWHQKPPREEIAAVTDLVPEGEPESAAELATDEPPPLRSEPRDEPEQAPLPRRRRPMVALGWIMLLLALGAVVGGAVWARDEVIAIWPPSIKLYELVGLVKPRPTEGLVIHARPRRDDNNGVPRLVIDGDITNATAVALPVPKLKVELKDATQRVVQTWTFSASTDRLLPGAIIPFTTSVERPNESATEVRVSLADGEN